MSKPILLITPEEAARLARECTMGDALIAYKIYKACNEAMKEERDLSENLAAIWRAGRVQGIREERQSKRRSMGVTCDGK